MSIRRDFPDLPPVWATGVLALQVAAALLLPWGRFASGGAAILGAVGCVAGLALILWAALWFRAKDTSIEPRDTPRALIVEGPFRLSRNPIYAGMALILIGAGLLLGSVPAILLALAFPPIVTRRFILEEEAALRRTFGPEAEEYLRGSRRW